MTKKQLVNLGRDHGVETFNSWPKGKIVVAIWNKLGRYHQSVRTDIDHHQNFSKSYFWDSPRNASNRRWMQNQESFSTEIRFKGSEYRYESLVSCSCRNVYYKGTFTIDGHKKNVTLWKKLREKIFAEMMKIEKVAKIG